MKDTTKVAVAGAAAGLMLMLAWQLVSNSDLQKKLEERMSKAAGTAKRQVKQIGEEAMLQRAQMTNDPTVNQRWVENQWDALA